MSVSVTSEAYPYLAVIGIIAILIIGFLVLTGKAANKKALKQQQRQRELNDLGIKYQNSLTLFSGLNLPENTTCKVSIRTDSLNIEANGIKYVLKNEKIKDACVKTDVEIRKQYVSSVGGAVGGAVLFGPIGAMIGGRAKEKTNKITHSYLIITYEKEGSPDYIAFNVTGNSAICQKFIAEYKGRTQQSTVEI